MTVTAQELARAGRRARARVEEGDVDLAVREALVEHGEVAHHEGEEAEAHACLDDGERAREGPDGSDIADAQREERGPAQVEIGPEAGVAGGRVESRSQSPLDHGEAEDERRRPAGHQDQDGQGTEDGEKALAPSPAGEEARHGDPGGPRGLIEEPRRSKGASGGAGEDERFEGVPDDREDQEDPRDRHHQMRH